MKAEYDIVVVGGGIVGLATSLALTARMPSLRLAVLEKEPEVSRHQSGNNSGVLHSGLYYKPGSLKARLSVDGADDMVAFCGKHDIPLAREGKVVVATDPEQIPALDELHRRGTANGLPGLRRIDPGELGEIEPHVAGVAALFVPTTGTVDFGLVSRTMADLLGDRGVEIMTSFPVSKVEPELDAVHVGSADGRQITARGLVNCAGLYADRVAAMAGVRPTVRIIPFRGEYYDLTGESATLVRHSVYPVPDSSLPFLGVHVTRTVRGTVHAGPNAVLAGAREGYRWRTVRPADLWDSVSYPGLLRLARRHWRSGLSEVLRSASRKRFASSVRRLVPDVTEGDLVRNGAGVRAQAISPQGELIHDFLIEPGPRSVHVLNAPSPGATASLAIGSHLATEIIRLLDL